MKEIASGFTDVVVVVSSLADAAAADADDDDCDCDSVPLVGGCGLNDDEAVVDALSCK